MDPVATSRPSPHAYNRFVMLGRTLMSRCNFFATCPLCDEDRHRNQIRPQGRAIVSELQVRQSSKGNLSADPEQSDQVKRPASEFHTGPAGGSSRTRRVDTAGCRTPSGHVSYTLCHEQPSPFGVLAAHTHVYAALLCGGFAAGLLILAHFSNRRDLFRVGLALGLSASTVFVIWQSMSLNSLGRIGSIEFSPGVVYHAARYVQELSIGKLPNVLLLTFLLVFGTLDRATRPFFVSFGVAFALFVLLPIIASVKQPMIVGRYWLVGAPALISLLVSLSESGFSPTAKRS